MPTDPTARTFLRRRTPTLKPNDPLARSVEDMVKRDLTEMPVVDDDGMLVGVLSQRAGLGHVLLSIRHHSPGATVGAVMRREVRAVTSGTPVLELAELFRQHRQGSVPVVNEGKLVGVVFRRDVALQFLRAPENVRESMSLYLTATGNKPAKHKWEGSTKRADGRWIPTY